MITKIQQFKIQLNENNSNKIEIYYVTDINNNVKNISRTNKLAHDFNKNALKNTGTVNYKTVLESDWIVEKITVSNIKNYNISDLNESTNSLNEDDEDDDLSRLDSDLRKKLYIGDL